MSSQPSLNHTTSDVEFVNTISPYTHGLDGVKLWLNDITSYALWGSLVFIAILVLVFRIMQVTAAYIRLLATMNSSKDEQKYWTQNSSLIWSKMSRYLLVAPLLHKRHNKELQLSSAIGIGTLPSRLHAIFLAIYLLSNILYCCLLDFKNETRPVLLAEVRGRTGHLAVMNMIPLFIFSTRNNPLIPLLGISFDTFNLFHRWIGRIVVLQSLAHTFFWGANNYDAFGLQGLNARLFWSGDWFLVYGFISTLAFVFIIFQSLSVIRHAFYESFLHLHQVLAVAGLLGVLLHVNSQRLPQKPYIYTLIAIWALERFTRLCRIFYRRGTQVRVEALKGGACRLTFTNIRQNWPNEPGRFIYIYLPSISLWMSHPFSVAWVDRNSSWDPNFSEAKNVTPSPSDVSEDIRPPPRRSRSSISCIVACRTGMTAALYRRANGSPTGTINLSAFVEGPYGGGPNLRSFGTVLLFAGGVGITHQISHIQNLISAFADGSCATRRVVLAWSARTTEQLDWAMPWIDELLDMPTRGNTLKILLYVSRSNQERQESSGLKEALHVSFGRMPVQTLIKEEFNERIGAMSIGVCGPGALADDVRSAARSVMDMGSVNFWEEAFTW